MHYSKLRTFFATVFVVLCFVAAHIFGWLIPVENFFRSFINPVSKKIYVAATSRNAYEEFKSQEALLEAYIQLREKYSTESVDAGLLEILKKENTELRNQLNFLNKTGFTHVGADVLGKNIELHSNTIVLNRGASDGVAVGNPVIAGSGSIVGKIKRVEEHTAVAQLISDQESKIAAQILNNEESPGIIEGGYKISVRMNLIPQNENVQIGDSVVTSGLESGIPKGLMIGRVEAVIKEAYQPFQEAIIVPIYSLDKLSVVSVLVTQ